MGEIVVGVDGSSGSTHALRWAAGEAEARGWHLVALMTWGYLDQRHPDGTEFEPGYDESDAARALEVFVSSALGEPAPGARAVVVERRLRNDLATPALLEAGRGADLLVLGARGLGGFKGLLLGSVSQACIHHAPCPVAIVREGTAEQASQDPPHDPSESGRVVVGVDGSPGARTALAWAVEEARCRRAPLEAVHTWDWPQMVGYPLGIDVDPDLCREGAERLLDAELAGVDQSRLVAPVRRTVRSGHAATALIGASTDAALLVVGTRGIGGFPGLLLGAVSHEVARHAACPVVVVPSPH